MRIQVATGGGSTTKHEFREDGPGKWTEERVETRPSTVKYREKPDAVELEIEMPGADPNGLDVSVKGRRLTVSWERREETRTTADNREVVETKRESMKKEVDLPVDVTAENADAVLKGGVLHVTIARKGVEDKGERVKVSVG